MRYLRTIEPSDYRAATVHAGVDAAHDADYGIDAGMNVVMYAVVLHSVRAACITLRH